MLHAYVLSGVERELIPPPPTRANAQEREGCRERGAVGRDSTRVPIPHWKLSHGTETPPVLWKGEPEQSVSGWRHIYHRPHFHFHEPVHESRADQAANFKHKINHKITH